jgi:hypothetical protein
LVDFICPGASRSGTTSLQWLLEQHPAVFVPPEKELTFFNDDQRYARGRAFYESFFDKRGRDQVAGEISPPYFHAHIRLDAQGRHCWSAEDSAARLKHDYPEVAIVVTLRDPEKRMHSQFWKNVLQGRETAESLDQAVREELDGRRPADRTALCWVYKNSYKTHLQRWQELVGSERVLVAVFEDWIRDPVPFVRRLERFLDVPEWAEPPRTIPRKNAGRHAGLKGLGKPILGGARALGLDRVARRFTTQQGYPPLDPEVARTLYNHFAADIAYVDGLTDGAALRYCVYRNCLNVYQKRLTDTLLVRIS